MPRVLSIATLYPNAHVPRFGTFVARQLEALAARDGWQVTVINPIGVPPVPMRRYKPLAASAVSGVEAGVDVRRPRFTLIPAVGGPFNPTMIVRAALPLARQLHAREPFDLVDAQFFYPDGPAAARIAADLGLPLSHVAGRLRSGAGRVRCQQRVFKDVETTCPPDLAFAVLLCLAATPALRLMWNAKCPMVAPYGASALMKTSQPPAFALCLARPTRRPDV